NVFQAVGRRGGRAADLQLHRIDVAPACNGIRNAFQSRTSLIAISGKMLLSSAREIGVVVGLSADEAMRTWAALLFRMQR
ncbi:MAG: hypothetical protein KDA85_21880, partial [Planctomycetaceae bacterium]|nr:hypothetical protein [Planctomycetaceae bacterium]